MSANLNPQKALIFRIVHRDNLPWILEHGLHARSGEKFDPDFRNIGNLELIGKRASHPVPIPPGGFLSDYVPFYFTPFSIMMYNIHTGHNGITKLPNEEIVYLVSSLPRVQELKIPFVFTDQHAYLATASFYRTLSDLASIDWGILQRRDFKRDPENDPGKTDRYQAEALVWKALPLEGLLAVCCHNETVTAAVKTLVDTRGLSLRVTTQSTWYF